MKHSFYCSLNNTRDGINRDRFIIMNDIFIVCDGISSYINSGEVAEQIISHCVKYKYPEKFDVQSANQFIQELNQIALRNKSGTTFTFLRLLENEGELIHTGDSECYKIQNNQIMELTIPFSFAYLNLYKNQQIELKDVKRTYGSNILVEYLGTKKELYPQLKRFKLEGNERFILCSDGANFCDENQMLETVKNNKEDPALEISNISRKNGSKDDITTIVLI